MRSYRQRGTHTRRLYPVFLLSVLALLTALPGLAQDSAGTERNAIRFTDDMWSSEAKSFWHKDLIYLDPDQVFPLDPFPPNDSPETRAELEEMVALKDRRTPQTLARIRREARGESDLELAMGEDLPPDLKDLVNELHYETYHDYAYFSYREKRRFKRARPSQLDDRIEPVIEVPGHSSYPSGHAGEFMIFARLYGAIDPSRAQQYRALARDVAERREIAGLHYKSDTTAGHHLADQVFTALMKNPEYSGKVEEAARLFAEYEARKAAREKEQLDQIRYLDIMWSTEFNSIDRARPIFLSQDMEIDVPAPPSNSSAETRAEIDELWDMVENARTEDQIEKILIEQKGQSDLVLGLGADIPADVARQVEEVRYLAQSDLDYFIYREKRRFKRARPTQIEPTLTTVIPVPGSPAYPSGHAAIASFGARVYAYVDPDNAGQYLDYGRDVGERRAISGIHYVSDGTAGEALADQVFKALLDVPEFKTAIDAARTAYQDYLSGQNRL